MFLDWSPVPKRLCVVKNVYHTMRMYVDLPANPFGFHQWKEVDVPLRRACMKIGEILFFRLYGYEPETSTVVTDEAFESRPVLR